MSAETSALWTFAGYHRTQGGWRFVGTRTRKEPQTHELLALLEQMADALLLLREHISPVTEALLKSCSTQKSMPPEEAEAMKRAGHDA